MPFVTIRSTTSFIRPIAPGGFLSKKKGVLPKACQRPGSDELTLF